MLQSRKATTYGKSSRKLFSDFPTLDEISEPTTEYVHGYDVSKSSTAQAADKKFLRRSINEQQFSTVGKVGRSGLQVFAGSESSGVHSQVGLYDFPSIGEDLERNSSLLEIRSRKRRRLMTKDDTPLASAMLDSEDQRRHVEAEVCGELDTIASVADEASEASPSMETYSSEIPTGSQCNQFSIHESRSHTSADAGVLDWKPSLETSSPHIIASKSPVAPVVRNKKETPVQTSSQKIMGCQGNSTKLRKSSTALLEHGYSSDLPTSGSSDDKWSQGKQNILPSTPRKDSSAAGLAATPKQRELWGKLLSSDTRKTSPYAMSTPGSCFTNTEDEAQNGKSESPTQTGNNHEAIEHPVKRSTKLTDFLMVSAEDVSSSESHYSGDYDSSDAERSPFVRSDVSTNNDDDATRQTSPSNGGQRQDKPLQLHDGAPAHISHPIPSLKRMPKVTYIRERTHLGDDHLSNTAMLDVPLMNHKAFSRKQKIRNTGIKQNEGEQLKITCNELDDIEGSQSGPMRSIHELREAGGNSRLAQELEAILDDLEDCIGSSIAARRSSLLRLASKLLEASTCRMFTDHGLEPRLLAQLKLSHDLIERSLMAASFLQIVNSAPAGSHSQINQIQTIDFLVELLDHKEDLSRQAKLRETNMSKLAQRQYITFCIAFLRSPAWRALRPPILSGHMLALQCLESLIRKSHEAGLLADILSSDTLNRVAETSLPPSETLHSESSYSRICVELAVSILESSTTCSADPKKLIEWTDSALERIIGVYPLSCEISRENGTLLRMTLRLYLNLTNASPHLCEKFSKPHLVNTVFATMITQYNLLFERDGQCQNQDLLEHLVLALGYLINLAESSDAMRRLALDLKIKGQSMLEILLQLFLQRRNTAAEAYSKEEAEKNVAYGYLSVLLSYLCINRRIKSSVNARLEGPAVNTLLDAVEEFLQYHRQVDGSTPAGSEGTDGRANFVNRLEGLVNELRFSV